MIVGGVRIGQQDGGHAGRGQLGQRRSAGSADGQTAGGHRRGQIGHERLDRRVQCNFTVRRPGRLDLRLARLMKDPPAGQQTADSGQRRGGRVGSAHRAPPLPPSTKSKGPPWQDVRGEPGSDCP